MFRVAKVSQGQPGNQMGLCFSPGLFTNRMTLGKLLNHSWPTASPAKRLE